MRTTFILTIVSTLLSFVVATPAGTLSSPNTNALLPLGARSAEKGCWEQCSNHLQCQGLCYRCSVNGRCHRPYKRDEGVETEAEVVAAPVSLPRDEAVDTIAYKGCWEQCSNHLQCQGICNRCSAYGRCHMP
ncbi:hypothetical protein ONS96_010864 [Cadophora gregata f. sp. sojae]|nr:hypothetical protein ONS96_010864 [Cadophora gregata f. sp. sojae]